MDSGLDAIIVFTKEGNFVKLYSKKGKGPGEFMSLKDFDIRNDFIYCLDDEKLSISKF
ncbi:MAG: 6-bladed beta-propeller, partial [Candidatus Cloacimonadia bacterium]